MLANQLQPLRCGRTVRAPQGVAQHRPQSEKSAGSSSSLPASIFDEVEQVVDEAEQVVGRRLDRLQALPLVVGQRRIEDQFGHAEDGAEGGADLVADVGQELVLGPVGRLRRLLRLSQLLGGLQPLDPVRGLPGQKIHDVQVSLHGEARRPVVGRQHADEPAGATDQGCGLHGPLCRRRASQPGPVCPRTPGWW